jgi:hypothetical protein
MFEDPLRDAVAPVMIREGGCGELETASRRRGRVALEKRKNPFLLFPSVSKVLPRIRERISVI